MLKHILIIDLENFGVRNGMPLRKKDTILRKIVNSCVIDENDLMKTFIAYPHICDDFTKLVSNDSFFKNFNVSLVPFVKGRDSADLELIHQTILESTMSEFDVKFTIASSDHLFSILHKFGSIDYVITHPKSTPSKNLCGKNSKILSLV